MRKHKTRFNNSLSHTENISHLKRMMAESNDIKEIRRIRKKIIKIQSKLEKNTLNIKSSSGHGGIANKGFEPPTPKKFITKAKLDENRKKCAELMREARNQ